MILGSTFENRFVGMEMVTHGVAEVAEPNAVFGMALRHVPLEELEQVFAGRAQPEWLRMYLAIARELPMGPSTGWFGPGQSRRDWKWLVDFCHADAAMGIARADFPGKPVWYDRLDRNLDGRITADDFDWSDPSPWMHYAQVIQRLFRRMDADGDGRLTRDEWIAFFDTATAGREFAIACELRDQWLAGLTGGYLAGDAPTRDVLLQGLFTGELGSRYEGPRVNDPAPDFELMTATDDTLVRLSDIVGRQPVVLVFGNMTCGPFRSIYPEVDRIARRYREEAAFLAVYVREAHPTEGWCMLSNECAGISTPQPKTQDERRAVAQACCELLQPTIPFLVDDIRDATGHAYSGMPARMYVIDSQGTVVYKGGRGPYGFKPREMEQALILTLLSEMG